MKRKIIQTRYFSKVVDNLLQKRQLLEEDFNSFKKELIEKPDSGDLITGTGGVRKTRLKSAAKGKSGGFRVCYYLAEKEELYLLLIYPKNEKEDLTMQEKKELKKLVNILKG
jgi:hypothetical protein